MKKLITSFALLAIFLGLGIQNTTLAAPVDDRGKITAEVTESKFVAPDTATISFSVETFNKNSQKAIEENNLIMSKITDNIKRILSKNETIKTATYNLNKKYEYNTSSKKNYFAGYEVLNTVTIILKDTTKTSRVIEIATQNGATDVSGLSFTVENAEPVCRELTVAAAKKAQVEAETILAALGKTIDSIANINYYCNTRYNSAPRFYLSKSMGSNSVESAGAPIETGENKITAQVTIVFTIK